MATKKGTNSVTFVILLLLIFGLAGFGVTNFGGSMQNVATVGSAEVGVNDYARAVDTQIQQFEAQTGQRLTFQQAQSLGLDRSALGQLINNAALENEAQSLGLSVGDENVGEEIRLAPAFQGVSGAFDREVYELSLDRNGINVNQFESRVRSDLAEGILRQAVADGIGTPDVFTDTLFNYARETRDVTWARLTGSDLATPLGTPTEGQLAEFHKNNAAQFTRPETKTISYAWLSPDMLVDGIEVSEDQIRSLYDARIDQFVQPERRLVERLVFADEAQAAGAKSRLDSGELTFDALVLERGLELSAIDLGDVSVSELGAAGDAIFALETPQVVGPLPSDLGPALFRMNGILAAQETSLEDVSDALKSEAALDRARRIILESIPQVENLLAGGADASVLAERTDMQEGSIDWNSNQFEGIAAYDAFRRAAATAQSDTFAEVIELADGGIAVLNVQEISPPTLNPLDDVRDDVLQAWELRETQNALEAQANQLADEIRQGREMAGLDLDLEVDRGLRRDAFVEGTPPNFTQSVFQLGPNELTVLSIDGEAWLLRMDAINVPETNSAEAETIKSAFAAQTSVEFATAISAAYARALVEGADVELNQAAMNAVNSQLQ